MRYQEKNQKIFAYIQGSCHEILGELIKWYNNQCESRSFIVNLSHSNELSVNLLSANLYSHGKIKLNCVKACKIEGKLNLCVEKY